MPGLHDLASSIVDEIARSLRAIDAAQVEQLVQQLLSAPRIFVAGRGRTGLQMRGFAMRLMQLGLTVYVVDEMVTPAIASGDLLVLGSASGQTASIVYYAGRAKDLGASVALLTIAPESPTAAHADVIVCIPAASHKLTTSESPSIQPRGVLFEQTLLVLLDMLIMQLIAARRIDEADMFRRHANLE